MKGDKFINIQKRSNVGGMEGKSKRGGNRERERERERTGNEDQFTIHTHIHIDTGNGDREGMDRQCTRAGE